MSECDWNLLLAVFFAGSIVGGAVTVGYLCFVRLIFKE